MQNIIVFPFYPIQNDFPIKYMFLKDAIPDIIRQEIIDSGLLFLVEKSDITSYTLEKNNGADFYKIDIERDKFAKNTKADYYAYGYFIIEDEIMYVYYHLVDVKTSRTKKIKKHNIQLRKLFFRKLRKQHAHLVNGLTINFQKNGKISLIIKMKCLIKNDFIFIMT